MPVWASFKNQHTLVWVGILEEYSSEEFFYISMYLNLALLFGIAWKAQLASVLLKCITKWCDVISSSNELIFVHSFFWPQIRQDYPLNLSILISGGKETNKDSPSNGEWSGISSNLKSPLLATANCSLEKRFQDGCAVLKLFGTTHHRGWQSRMWHCALLTMRFLWVGLLGNAAQNWR